MLIPILIKFVVGLLFSVTAVCEFSDMFDDSWVHVTLRYALMISCLAVVSYAGSLAALPLLSQWTVLTIVTVSSMIIYKYILMDDNHKVKYKSFKFLDNYSSISSSYTVIQNDKEKFQ